jgi:hypothetical protein
METGSVKSKSNRSRCARQPSQRAAAGHAANEHTRIAGEIPHTNTIAEYRAP